MRLRLFEKSLILNRETTHPGDRLAKLPRRKNSNPAWKWVVSIAVASLMSSTVVNQAAAQVYEYGSSGSTVQRIQKFLGVNPTGTYDFATQAAVASFQRQRGLSVDGRVGPETLAAMGLTDLMERPVNYERPVAFDGTAQPGMVVTQSGIGLNIRRGPGLNYPIVGGAEDGALVELGTQRVLADNYRWADIRSGGWVATEYVASGTTSNVSYYDSGNCSTYCGMGGTTATVNYTDQGNVNLNGVPNTTDFNFGGYRSGPYVVVVPGSGSALLGQVRRIAWGAFPDKARQGAFINAGSFNDVDRADALSSQLRAIGLDARVAYRPR